MPELDSLYRRRRLNAGNEARCERCGALLYRATPLTLDSWLALTMGTGVAFFIAIANVYPMFNVSLHAMQNAVTLWQAAIALARGATLPLSVGAVLFLIVVPLLQITLLG